MSHDKDHLNHNIKNNPEEDTDQDFIIYSKLTHHDSQFKKGKNKRLPEVDPSEPCYIHQLSVELITHIFSRLDPNSLATASKVCAYWNHIVNNDSSWRNAFVYFFGCLPFKRLSTESWKTEYILRSHLIRKWKRGRGSIMTFNPKIGSLESMNVNFEESAMLVASTDDGVAAKCNPMTGKVSHRHLMFSSNENVRLPISAVKMDAHRVMWGSLSGYVTLTTRTQTASKLKVFSDFHHGPVTVLCLPTSVHDVVLSGAMDGNVKIWDVSTATCAYTLYPVSALARVPTCIEVTTDYRILIGYDDGSLVVWNCNLHHLIQVHRRQHQEDYAETMRRSMEKEKLVIQPPAERLPVKSVYYDSETRAVIVAYQGSTDVYKFNVDSGERIGIFTSGHQAGTTVTCMRWDTSPLTSILTLESAIKKKNGSIIDVSSSTSSSGQTTPQTGRTTRLLVTGDDLGTVCLWNGDEQGQAIKPIRILSGHIVGISSIFIDACKVVTGSDDGWIYMWDPLTGEKLNALGNKIPKKAPVDRSDVNVMRVKNIWCNDYQGIATIGHQVKTWDFSPTKQFLNRRTLKQRGKPCGDNMRGDRLKYELGREVKESIQKLASDREEKERHEREMNKLSLGGLSDQEMMDYAMMLSQQDMPSSTPQHDFVDENDDELMKAIIASLDSADINQKEEHPIEIENWPTLSEAGSSTSRSFGEEEDIDEELRYVLEMSKTDK